MINNQEMFDAMKYDNELISILSRIYVSKTEWISFVYCMKKSNFFYTFPVSIFIRENSKHKRKLDQIIRRIFEAGMINHWMNILPAYEREIHDIHVSALTIDQMVSVFMIMLIGCTFSSIIFVLEIIVHRKLSTVTNKNRKCWKFLSQILDPKRYFCIFNDQNEHIRTYVH